MVQDLSVEMGFDAFNTGYDIFASICREKYFSDAQVLQHYSRLSDSLKMPLLVHEMPFCLDLMPKYEMATTLIESLLEMKIL